MESVHVALAVLSLLSVGHSAPVTSCESLVRPLELNRDQLLGKWSFIAESSDITAAKLLTDMFVDTVSAQITANDADGIDVLYMQKMLGRCFSLTVSTTLANNTLSMAQPYVSSSIRLSSGCPDCLVFSTKSTIGTFTYFSLQLLSKRSKVTAAELEEFKKQAECLDLLSPAVLDGDKGFCSLDSQEAETTDLTESMKRLSSQFIETFNSVINSESGLNQFIKLVSSGIPGIKQN
ncbi:uncharacterized protein LOC113162173 [Anabas testudineus]|uniref:uncharacterized protein LOC113162173 n=1 Tax=Anabas testudineus TaxID=64144 RepID=UPI000E45B9D8|nr:uncharacterized protein LOC113162173 [Anabas testudineus]